METDTTLVRTDGIIVLNTVAHVILHLTLVINPRNAEREDAVRNTQTVNQIISFKFGILIIDIFNSGQHFFHCLDILRFIRETTFQIVDNFNCLHTLN